MLNKLINKISKLFVKDDIYYKISFIRKHIDILDLMYSKEPYYVNVLLTNKDIYTSIQSMNFLFKNNFGIELYVDSIATANISYERTTLTKWFTNDSKTIKEYSKVLLEWLDMVHTLNDTSDNLIIMKDYRINNIIFFRENINEVLNTVFEYIIKEI